jgi:hypothetical protein
MLQELLIICLYIILQQHAKQSVTNSSVLWDIMPRSSISEDSPAW